MDMWRLIVFVRIEKESPTVNKHHCRHSSSISYPRRPPTRLSHRLLRGRRGKDSGRRLKKRLDPMPVDLKRLRMEQVLRPSRGGMEDCESPGRCSKRNRFLFQLALETCPYRKVGKPFFPGIRHYVYRTLIAGACQFVRSPQNLELPGGERLEKKAEIDVARSRIGSAGGGAEKKDSLGVQSRPDSEEDSYPVTR